MGPALIVNLERLSVMLMDPRTWPASRREINSPGFQRQIGANALIDTASLENGGVQQQLLFPRMFICRVCGLVQRRIRPTESELRTGLHCSRGDGELYPSRWITYCALGHIGDFDYGRFVHGQSDCGGATVLTTAASLAETIVTCFQCGAARSMIEAYSEISRMRCDGHRPWMNAAPEACRAAVPKLSM